MDSWAILDDFYSRFGEEFINKLGIRRNWDATLGQYVASEDETDVQAVLELAIADAKELLKQRLRCKFKDLTSLENYLFSPIKQWHMKLTIEILKVGGDCLSCDCTKVDEWIKCNNVCSDDGSVCLSSNATFFEVSPAKFKCECEVSCKC